MDRVLNENDIINDIIDEDFQHIKKNISDEKYDHWSQIHSQMSRKKVNVLL